LCGWTGTVLGPGFGDFFGGEDGDERLCRFTGTVFLGIRRLHLNARSAGMTLSRAEETSVHLVVVPLGLFDRIAAVGEFSEIDPIRGRRQKLASRRMDLVVAIGLFVFIDIVRGHRTYPPLSLYGEPII
jgi:hypothetical protein